MLRARETSRSFAWRYLLPQWSHKSDLVNVQPTLGSFTDAKGTRAPAVSRVPLSLLSFLSFSLSVSFQVPRKPIFYAFAERIRKTGLYLEQLPRAIPAIIRLLSASWINIRQTRWRTAYVFAFYVFPQYRYGNSWKLMNCIPHFASFPAS